MADDIFFKGDDNTNLTDTPPQLISETINKVEAILKDHYPDYLSFGNGTFTISRGSSHVMIIVRPYTQNETCVEYIANVVTGAKITSELMRFLLRKNSELHFGSFGLIFDDTITFSHTITGSSLTKDQLVITLNSIAVISDYYDDIIVDLAGGKRASDLVEDLEN